MKRLSEKRTLEELKNGAVVVWHEWFTLYGGSVKVEKDGEIIGYIVDDLYFKLCKNKTIVRTHSGYDYTEYALNA